MEPHEQLDAALEARRLAARPRMEWNDVAAELGIKPRSLLDIRRGRNGPNPLTASAMDEWLGWPPGAVKTLLAGGGLPPVAEHPPTGTSEQIAVNRAGLDELAAILEQEFEKRRGKPLTETQKKVATEMFGSIERTIEALDEESA